MDYLVKFIGVMDNTKRPLGFPHQIMAIGTYEAQNPVHLAQIINEELNTIIRNGGMIVSRDPGQMIDMTKLNIDGRFYVPMHMIAYIFTQIRMTTPVPRMINIERNDKGLVTAEFETPDGKKVLPS